MSGIGNFFNRSQQPLETSGDITLKKGVTKDNFVTKVEKSLDDGILTKQEYKQIKDSMVGGRESLNNILSQAGIADLKQLDTIFGRGKEHGYISISPNQKQELKSLLLNGANSNSQNPVQLTKEESVIRDNIVNKHLSVNRDNLAERYTMNDFIFSPEVSGIFKAYSKNQHSDENISFLVDTKKTLENPTKEGLTNLYNKYIKKDSEGYINLSDKNRKECDRVFNDSNNSTLSDMMNKVGVSVSEIKSMSGDIFSRFSSEKKIAQAIINEAVYLPAGSGREKYIKSIENAHENKDNSISSVIKSNAKSALEMTAKILSEVDWT